MVRLSNVRIPFGFVLILSVFFLLACDVASLVSQAKPPTVQPSAQVQPTGQTASTGTTPVPTAAGDAQSRISDSVNRLLMMDKKVLDSYHLEASGTSPEWNRDTKKVVVETFTFKADVSSDNVHFTRTTQTDKKTVVEGYIMNANAQAGGDGYAVENGKLKQDLFMPISWVSLPLEFGMPLIFASMGPTPRGDEAVDGRAAEKFDVDMAKAPAGAVGTLRGFGIGYANSKGTAWLDKQTGTLLKMTIDYESDIMDAGTLVGKGSGHIDLAVTQVGKVSVTLPPATAAGPTVPATSAPTVAAQATAALTPTAAPSPIAAKVGQRAVLQGVALTVTKAQALDLLGGQKPSTGNRWVVVTVTVENAGNAPITVEEAQFEYVDKNGAVVPGLLNGPSAPGTSGKDVFGMYPLTLGGKVVGKTLPIQMKKESIPGLRLRFKVDAVNGIVVNLGL